MSEAPAPISAPATGDKDALDPTTQLWMSRIQSCKDQRTLWEAQVATCMHFAAGHHRIWWDDRGMMREKVIQDNEVFRIINLWPVALSANVTRLMGNDPRWNPRKSSELEKVTPEEEEAADSALREVWEGDHYGDKSIKPQFKLAIRLGFLQGGSLMYYRFDEETGLPCVERFALWDVYSDMSSQTLYDKMWLTIVLPKSIDWLKAQAEAATSDTDTETAQDEADEEKSEGEENDAPEDPAQESVENGKWYPEVVKKLQADGILAESRLQQQYLGNRMGAGARKSNRDTAKIMFCFEPKTRSDGTSYIHYQMVSYAGIIFEQELDGYDNLTDIFDVYHPVETGEFYARPPCMDWVDPQKTINKIYSNIESYIDNHLQGKWFIYDKNVSIPIAGNQGQKIFANAIGDLQQLPMEGLPGTHFQHLQQAITQFEQISGVHSESMGRQSGSADSGIAIAQLQALDEQNSADPVDNFKMFLKRSGQKLLQIMSDNWDDTRTLYHYNAKTGTEKQMKVIGQASGESRTLGKDTVMLRPFKRLDVEIVIGQFFSSAQKRQDLKDILSVWQPGVNPQADKIVLPLVLDSFSIGVGRELAKEIENLTNPHQQIAQGKSQLVANGQDVPVNMNDPHEFLQNHYADQATQRLSQGDQQGAQALNAQAAKHGAFVSQGIGAAGNPLAMSQQQQ